VKRVLTLSFLLVAVSARAQVVIDTREPEAVLEIADSIARDGAAPPPLWDALFATAGYRDLQAREAAMQRPFTDDQFRAFVTGVVVGQRDELRRTLADWKRFDVDAAAARARRYLPAGTQISATVYPLIKPKTNSFVFRTSHGMAIFLYLDPAVTGPKFENTVVHELHHIGYAAACPAQSDASTPEATARLYLGGFGEGLAVLAAAGDARTHPHATSTKDQRAVWNRDVKKVAADIRRLEAFLTGILDRRLAGDAIQPAFMQFIATDDVPQGAFYTVGWKMASTIERARGRDALVGMICDPVWMMGTYNELVKRPVWSEALLRRLEAK